MGADGLLQCAHLYPVTVTLSVSPGVSPLSSSLPNLQLSSLSPQAGLLWAAHQCPILHVSPTNLHPTLPPTTNILTPSSSSFNHYFRNKADNWFVSMTNLFEVLVMLVVSVWVQGRAPMLFTRLRYSEPRVEREESVTRAEREWWAVGGLLWAASDTSHCTMGENIGLGGHLAFLVRIMVFYGCCWITLQN